MKKRFKRKQLKKIKKNRRLKKLEMKIQYLVAVLSFLYLSDSAPVDNDETGVMLSGYVTHKGYKSEGYPSKKYAEGESN